MSRIEDLPLERHDPEPPDPASFLRLHPEAQELLAELDQQPGKVQRQPSQATTTPRIPIGQRLTQQMSMLSQRSQVVREMEAIARQRVLDLTAEQLRSILQFTS